MRVVPFGDRILVKRRKIGEKSGTIVLPDQVQERPTDIADVIYIPDLTFADKQILEGADSIVESIVKTAKEGNSYAVNTLMEFNNYIKQKSIKVGDAVMISKYVGVDFHETGSNDLLTLVSINDLIGLVVPNE